MMDGVNGGPAGGWRNRLVTRIGRRNLALAAGLAGVAGLRGQERATLAAAQADPTAREASNALITLEAFAVTFYGVARNRATGPELTDEITRFVRAAQCGEEAHFHFFESVGGAPSTTTFTIDPGRIDDQPSFLARAIELEELLIGAHMAAARVFAGAGQLRLVEIAYQAGAVEAQHLALLRQFSGERTPANRAFARWRFASPASAVAVLTELGYIGGDGDAFSYPGPVDRFCRGMFGLVPETTDDVPDDLLAPAGESTPAA